MTQLQSFCLYLDTILIIVFILANVLRTKKKNSYQETEEFQAATSDERAIAHMGYAARTEGDMRLVGVDEELVPVILAGISASVNIPMSALKIKSIARI